MLNWIVKNSDSAALISVVASVCMARPKVASEQAISVLGCREFFGLDMRRSVQESGAMVFGSLGAMDKIFQDERLESNRLPHRKGSLEDLARNLQFTNAKDELLALLDYHRAQLPAIEDQDDEDRIWRLALDRMDMRRYSVEGPEADGKVLLHMDKPADDIQEMLDKAAPAQEAHTALIGLYMWGRKAFENETGEVGAFADCAIRLEAVRNLGIADAAHDEAGFGEGARNGVAAVCIRDHWNEMDSGAREWCKQVALRIVEKPLSGDHGQELFARNPMNGSAECAFVIPLMAARDAEDARLVSALMASLTHFNLDVKQSAISGVSTYVLGKNSKLASLCFWTLIEDAKRNNDLDAQRRSAKVAPREGLPARLKAVLEAMKAAWADATGPANAVEKLFAGKESPNFDDLTFDTWHDRGLATSLLNLLRNHPGDPLAEAFFEKIASVLLLWWEDDRKSSDRHDRRDFELEHLASKSLAEYVLFCPLNGTAKRLAQVLIPAISTEPKHASEFLRSLLLAEDRRAKPSNYWELWKLWTASIEQAGWFAHIDDEHSYGQPFVRDAFLNIKWNEDIRTWSRLGDHHHDVDALFDRLPASTLVLRSYADYLYRIGESSLPGAFVLITKKFEARLGESFIADGTLRWYMDALISRCLFENLTPIRRSPALRSSVMATLDALVQAGSSIAFQLRDDFVTPTAMPNATESSARG